MSDLSTAIDETNIITQMMVTVPWEIARKYLPDANTGIFEARGFPLEIIAALEVIGGAWISIRNSGQACLHETCAQWQTSGRKH
jgi:hypothetical protein